MSSPAVHALAAGAVNSPAAFQAGTPAGQQQQHGSVPSPASAMLAILSNNPFASQVQTSGSTPVAPSPSAMFLGSHQSPAPGTPGGLVGLGRPPVAQQQSFLGLNQFQQHAPAPSLGGSAAAHSASGAGTTAADAPNEARRLLRALLDEQGQGRLSLTRIANEVNTLVQDVNNAFTTIPAVNPAVRLADLLACLDELQVQLARTGLGGLPVTSENIDFSNIQAMIANMAAEVQASFKHRQRIREGAGVAKSTLVYK